MSSVLTVLICSWARAAVRLISALAGLAGPAARAALTMTYSGAKLPPKDCAVADRGVRTANEAPPKRRARLDMEIPEKEWNAVHAANAARVATLFSGGERRGAGRLWREAGNHAEPSAP